MSLKWGRLLILVLVLCLGMVVLQRWVGGLSVDRSIPARGGASLVVTNIPVQPYYLQTDPAWAAATVGGSGESLAKVGCTVCCVSMAFTQFGLLTDPGALNAALKREQGYTRTGLLKWERAAAASGGSMAFTVPSRPDHVMIEAALLAGDPVVAKILLGDSVPHWVLIVGKQGQEYLVKNPLCRERDIQILSTLSSRIQTIRIVRRTGTVIQ